jgi:hypothetical protein
MLKMPHAAEVLPVRVLLDPIFHQDSYGYRPGKSAKQAVAVTRKRCWLGKIVQGGY